jgi:hypothetical protein
MDDIKMGYLMAKIACKKGMAIQCMGCAEQVTQTFLLLPENC